MAVQQIQTGNQLSDGITYHAQDINAAINNATLLGGFITAQPFTTAADDNQLIVSTVGAGQNPGAGGLARTTMSSAKALFSTNLTTTGYLSVSNGFSLTGFATDTISGTKNNYNPTNLDKASVIGLSGTATLTGLMAGPLGKIVIIRSGAGTITINFNDVGSDPANRFTGNAGGASSLPLIAGQVAAWQYQGATVAWQLLFTNRFI